MLKSPKTKTLADGLIERSSSMLDEINQQPWTKMKVMNRRKRSKTLNEVK